MLAACERQNRVIFTPFLSQGEGMIAQRLCGRGQPYAFDGGYPGAERCCYAFLPYPDMEVRFPICLLKAAYRPRFETLTHRDVLGAFMHQGIEREQLGDIVMTQDAVYVAVSESISGYLIDQVTKIRHTSLREIISTDLLGTVSGSDLAASFLRLCILLLLQFEIIQLGTQQCKRFLLVLDL